MSANNISPYETIADDSDQLNNPTSSVDTQSEGEVPEVIYQRCAQQPEFDDVSANLLSAAMHNNEICYASEIGTVNMQQQHNNMLPSSDNTTDLAVEPLESGRVEIIAVQETGVGEENIEHPLFRCNSCGYIELNDEDDDIDGAHWQGHANFNLSCPSIQPKIEADFIDMKAKKTQVFGDNLEHLRLKEWLLCRMCSMWLSNTVLFPCQHFCICQVCAQTAEYCPTCGRRIEQKLTTRLVDYYL